MKMLFVIFIMYCWNPKLINYIYDIVWKKKISRKSYGCNADFILTAKVFCLRLLDYVFFFFLIYFGIWFQNSFYSMRNLLEHGYYMHCQGVTSQKHFLGFWQCFPFTVFIPFHISIFIFNFVYTCISILSYTVIISPFFCLIHREI